MVLAHHCPCGNPCSVRELKLSSMSLSGRLYFTSTNELLKNLEDSIKNVEKSLFGLTQPLRYQTERRITLLRNRSLEVPILCLKID